MPAPAREHAVDRAHAERQRRVDHRARERAGRRAIEIDPRGVGGYRGAVVERPAEPVDDAPEQKIADRNPVRPPERAHRAARRDAARFGERRQQRRVAVDRDDFGVDPARLEPAQIAEADARQRRAHERRADLDDAAEAHAGLGRDAARREPRVDERGDARAIE